MSLLDLTITEQTTIGAPPGAVWEVFGDLPSWPTWNRSCLAADMVAGTPWSVGSSFRIVLRMAGVPVPFHPSIVEAELPRRVGWSSTHFTITGTRSFTFDAPPEGDATPEGTVVTDEMRFTSRVVPVRLLYPRPVIRAMSRGWLQSLKEEVERRARG